jgi:hypothetical protein
MLLFEREGHVALLDEEGRLEVFFDDVAPRVGEGVADERASVSLRRQREGRRRGGSHQRLRRQLLKDNAFDRLRA